MIKSGAAWAGSFVTLDATGALAAGSPSGVLYVDGVANGATVTITGSNPYKFSVTLPSLTAGQRVDMYITATIDTIATAGFVAGEQADTSLLSDGVTLADDAISASKFDESTAFPVKSADTGTTQLARTGADSDTLETLSDQMDGIATWSAAAISASYTAGAISQIRGNTWDFDADDLTLDDTLIQFVIKNNANDQDEDSILMIDNVTGLLRVNGEAGTAGDASLAYAGTTLTVEVAASVTALLPAGVYHYGIQSIDASGNVSEAYGGTFTITADMVRATA